MTEEPKYLTLADTGLLHTLKLGKGTASGSSYVITDILNSHWMSKFSVAGGGNMDGLVRQDIAKQLTEKATMSEVNQDGTVSRLLFITDDYVASVSMPKEEGTVYCAAYTASAELTKATADRYLGMFCEPIAPDTSKVAFRFWRLTSSGVGYSTTQILSPTWDVVERNYPEASRSELNRLMSYGEAPSAGHGKLLLMHGPAGTGKSSLIKTLGQQWRAWCSMHVVLDGEKMFGNADYMVSLMAELPNQDKGRWNMLVLEDCDELIRAGAHGQSVSRLLNLTDGLLGMGKNIAVMLTTNEDIGALHPAVMRPGRCLAQLEIGKFSPEESHAWLSYERGTNEAMPEDQEALTLAELYAEVNSAAPVTVDATSYRRQSIGFALP